MEYERAKAIAIVEAQAQADQTHMPVATAHDAAPPYSGYAGCIRCCCGSLAVDSDGPPAYSYQIDEQSWQPFSPRTSHTIASTITESPHGGRCDLSSGKQLRWGYDLAYTDHEPVVQRTGLLAFFLGQPQDKGADFNDRIEEAALLTGLVMIDVGRLTVCAVRRDQTPMCVSAATEACHWVMRQLDRPAVRPRLLVGLALFAAVLFVAHVGVLWFSVAIWSGLAMMIYTSVQRGRNRSLLAARSQGWLGLRAMT